MRGSGLTVPGRGRPAGPASPVMAMALAVVGAVALAGCSGSTHHRPGAPAVTTTAAPAPTSTASPPTSVTSTTAAPTTTDLARCTTAQLDLRADGGSAATGHALALFALRNTGSKACRLTGYPGVRLLSPSGTTLTDAQRSAGFILGDAPATAVTVPPGQSAYFGVESVNVCQGGANPVPSATLRVTPPDETTSLTVAAVVNSCPGASSVLVSPVRATTAEVPRH